MKNPLISVIVPVYKVEQYLAACLNSIVNQTYKNLEIILVDDGSPDNCGKICDEYAQKDSRIVVLHQPNGGVSRARNAGLDIAKGEYIAFVDSDDYIALDMYEELMSIAQKQSADVAICGIYVIKKDGMEIFKKTLEGLDTNGIKYQFLINSYPSFPWGRLYKTKLFQGVRFPVGLICYEDMFVMPKILSNADKIVFAPKPYY
ncbi:MAG: glycosyltransferase, partial [Campylobacteraceae bacterium]|nr:glycosyltransferase [Campylobacteraceae bacterium]